MIVTMPKIAVSPTPAKMPIASGSPSGKFSAALATATAATQDGPAKPNAVGSGNPRGSNASGTVNTKGNSKGVTKSASSSIDSSSTTQLNVAVNQEAVKAPLTNILLASPVTPKADAQESADPSTSSDSDVNAAPASLSSTSLSTTLLSVPVAQPTVKPIPGQSAVDGSQQVAAQTSSPATDGVAAAANAPVEDSSEKASNDRPKIAKAVEAAKSSVLGAPAANAAPAKMPVPETKIAPRETVHIVSPVDPKTTVSSSEHKNATADVPQVPAPVVADPTTSTADVRPELLQQVQSSNVVAGKSDRGIVLPSSDSKKDGDAAKNPPPSDKSDSTVPVALSKQDPTNPAVQPVSGPDTTDGSVQNPVTGVDSKPAGSTVPAKAGDAVAKSPDQFAAALKEHDATEPVTLPVSSPLQVAKLMERAGQTELRVGIQAGEFGSVDIRTSMARNQFSAEISVERGELGRALSAELPSLHSRLAEQRLPMPNITLQDHSAGNQSGDFRQGTRQNQYQQPANYSGGFETGAGVPMVAAELADASARLDIHM